MKRLLTFPTPNVLVRSIRLILPTVNWNWLMNVYRTCSFDKQPKDVNRYLATFQDPVKCHPPTKGLSVKTYMCSNTLILSYLSLTSPVHFTVYLIVNRSPYTIIVQSKFLLEVNTLYLNSIVLLRVMFYVYQTLYVWVHSLYGDNNWLCTGIIQWKRN